MKVLLFSSDPVALDTVVCHLIDLNPEYVPFLKAGYDSGLGTYKFDEIELLGDDITQFIQSDFKVKRRPIIQLRSEERDPFKNAQHSIRQGVLFAQVQSLNDIIHISKP